MKNQSKKKKASMKNLRERWSGNYAEFPLRYGHEKTDMFLAQKNSCSTITGRDVWFVFMIQYNCLKVTEGEA